MVASRLSRWVLSSVVEYSVGIKSAGVVPNRFLLACTIHVYPK